MGRSRKYTNEEIIYLLERWGTFKVELEETGTKLSNRDLFTMISNNLVSRGFARRDASSLEDKLGRIRNKYLKDKDHNRRSSVSPEYGIYHQEMERAYMARKSIRDIAEPLELHNVKRNFKLSSTVTSPYDGVCLIIKNPPQSPSRMIPSPPPQQNLSPPPSRLNASPSPSPSKLISSSSPSQLIPSQFPCQPITLSSPLGSSVSPFPSKPIPLPSSRSNPLSFSTQQIPSPSSQINRSRPGSKSVIKQRMVRRRRIERSLKLQSQDVLKHIEAIMALNMEYIRERHIVLDRQRDYDIEKRQVERADRREEQAEREMERRRDREEREEKRQYDRDEREMDRKERELERKERDMERREREVVRKEREVVRLEERQNERNLQKDFFTFIRKNNEK